MSRGVRPSNQGWFEQVEQIEGDTTLHRLGEKESTRPGPQVHTRPWLPRVGEWHHQCDRLLISKHLHTDLYLQVQVHRPKTRSPENQLNNLTHQCSSLAVLVCLYDWFLPVLSTVSLPQYLGHTIPSWYHSCIWMASFDVREVVRTILMLDESA